MDIQEIIRRVRAGESDRAIHQALGIHRDTVRKYREWASEHELLTGELPDLATLQQWLNETQASSPPPQNLSSVEPYRELVQQLRAADVEIAAIYQRLQEQGYQGSYQSVWRFVRKLEPGSPDATVRVESPPGQEAQVDFGYAGRMVDDASGKERPAWAFVMTLAYRAMKLPLVR